MAANNSRISGDSFEHQITSFLLMKGLKYHDVYTKTKHDKLKNKINNNCVQTDTVNKCLSDVFNHMNLDQYKTIKFTKDNDGKKGITSDVELYNDNNFIGISCKVNNISIKHQRPSSLYRQMDMNQQKTEEFKQEYKICNDKWFNKFQKLTTFDKIDATDKITMYSDFNNIIKNCLNMCTEEQTKKFYNFLIHYDKIYILHNDVKKKKITLYDYLNTPLPTKILDITNKNQNITILFNNNIKINMRLHNASKSITKSLSLKYDTTILEGELFTKHEFNLS